MASIAMIPLRIYFKIFYYLRARFVVANLIKMTENILISPVSSLCKKYVR